MDTPKEDQNRATMTDLLETVDHRLTQALGVVWTLHLQQDDAGPRSPLQNALWGVATLLEQASKASEAAMKLELERRNVSA